MNAREHRREAERLLAIAPDDVVTYGDAAGRVARAQVHATLATALMNEAASRRLVKAQTRAIEWAEQYAASVPKDEATP